MGHHHDALYVISGPYEALNICFEVGQTHVVEGLLDIVQDQIRLARLLDTPLQRRKEVQRRATRSETVGRSPRDFTLVGSTIFFSGNDGTTGPELWKTDGTSSGTNLVKEIRPGGLGSQLSNFLAVGNTLFFTATDGSSGLELFKSDGTSSGTGIVKDIRPGAAAGSTPTMLTNVAGAIYFSANDGTNGIELWRSDGTSSGTTLLDIEPGIAAAPTNLVAVGDRLNFSANFSTVGVELFSLREDNVPPLTASITSTSGNGTYSTGQSVNITLIFSEPVTLAGGSLLVTLDTGAVISIAPFNNSASASGNYIVATGETSPDLNVTALALGAGATLRDAVGNNADLALALSNLANNAALVINPSAPNTVSFIVVNQSAIQRSRLTTINVNFTASMDVAIFQNPGAVTRTLGGPVTVVTIGSGLIVTPGSGNSNAITLKFQNVSSGGVEFASLADGRWQLAIPSLNYTSPLNDPNLRRLFGDINGDGTIDGPNDFSAFGAAFGITSVASPFDFNNDGTIDGSNDFSAFGARFGLTL